MKLASLCVSVLVWSAGGYCFAVPVVIAGSSEIAPPAFQTGPHFQITQVIDRAHPFTIAGNGQYRVDELQIAAYRLAGLGGLTAQFAIRADVAGVPGSALTTFSFGSIPLATPEVLSATPNQPLTLQAGTPYWIVGTTGQGQVNWSLAMGTFPQISVSGPNAYQLREDPWVVSPTGQLAAYAILGSPVPEPSAGLIALCAGTVLATARRRR